MDKNIISAIIRDDVKYEVGKKLVYISRSNKRFKLNNLYRLIDINIVKVFINNSSHDEDEFLLSNELDEHQVMSPKHFRVLSEEDIVIDNKHICNGFTSDFDESDLYVGMIIKPYNYKNSTESKNAIKVTRISINKSSISVYADNFYWKINEYEIIKNNDNTWQLPNMLYKPGDLIYTGKSTNDFNIKNNIITEILVYNSNYKYCTKNNRYDEADLLSKIKIEDPIKLKIGSKFSYINIDETLFYDTIKTIVNSNENILIIGNLSNTILDYDSVTYYKTDIDLNHYPINFKIDSINMQISKISLLNDNIVYKLDSSGVLDNSAIKNLIGLYNEFL